MWEESEQLAALIFSSSAIMMAIALVLISSCWKSLKELLSTLPPEQRKIIFILKHIGDKRKKYREELKGSLWLAILFLGLMVLSNLVSMLCVMRTMLGLHGGILGETSIFLELQDIAVARWSVIASVLFLLMSLASLSFYRFSEFLAFRKGKLELIKDLSSGKVPTRKKRKTRVRGHTAK
jgi:hypothetical protein